MRDNIVTILFPLAAKEMPDIEDFEILWVEWAHNLYKA